MIVLVQVGLVAKLSVPIENHGSVKITDITPNVVVQGQGTKMVVKGEGFDENISVFITPNIGNSKNLISKLDTYLAIQLSISNDNKFIYLSDEYHGFKIIDIHNINKPTILFSGLNNPTLLNEINIEFECNNIKLYDKIILLNNDIAFDISNINNPKKINFTAPKNEIVEFINKSNIGWIEDYSIDYEHNIVYVAQDFNGVNVYKIGKNKLKLLGNIDTYRAMDVALIDNGRKIIVADYEKGIKIYSIDIVNYKVPTIGKSWYKITDYNEKRNFACSVRLTEGVDIYIVFNNNTIEMISHIDIYEKTIYAKFSENGNKLFITGESFKTYDISDIKNPNLISSKPLYAYMLDLNKDENIIALAGGSNHLKIYYFINNKINKIYENNDNYADSLYFTKNNKLFVTSETEGIFIYDISDINNVNLQYTIKQYHTYKIRTNNEITILYLIDRYGQMKIFDIQDISNPILISKVGFQATDVHIGEISKDFNYYFEPYENEMVRVYNIKDVYKPKMIATISLDDVESIVTTNNKIFFNSNSLNIGSQMLDFYEVNSSIIDYNTINMLFPDYSLNGNYNLFVTNNNTNYSKAHGGITLISKEEALSQTPKNLILRTIEGKNGIINIDLNSIQAIKLNALLEFEDGHITNVFKELNSSEYTVSTSDKNKAYYFNDKLIFNDMGRVTVSINTKGLSDSLNFNITNSAIPTTFQDKNKEAIIILGHLDDKGGELSVTNSYDPLRYSINKIGNNIYKTLSKFGLSQNDIHYFNPNGEQNLVDEDNDKIKDNAVDFVDFTWSDVVDTINSLDVNSTEPLIFWMVDHGDKDSIKISKNISVTTSQIKKALDDFQAKSNRTIIAIIDSCYSGTIAQAIKGDNRIVISSSDALTPTYMDSYGVSFSHYLLKYLQRGNGVKASFDKAKEIYNKKLKRNGVSINPIYSNQNTGLAKKLYSTIDEDYKLSDYDIGNGEVNFLDYTAKDKNLTITNQSIELKVKTDTPYPSMINLYALITPPNPIQDVQSAKVIKSFKVELTLDENDNYFKSTYNFDINGTYTVTYMLKDDEGSSYLSDSVSIIQINGTENNLVPNTKNITLTKGWNLVALDKDDLSTLKDISVIWQYIDNQWRVFTNIQTTLPKITKLSSNYGTWIYSNKSQTIQIQDAKLTTQIYLNKWNLVGTAKDIETTSLNCKEKEVQSIWKYKNNTWLLKTKVANNLNLESFDTIKANKGFWINCGE